MTTERQYPQFGVHSLADGFALKDKAKLLSFLELCKKFGASLVEIPVPGIQMAHDRLIKTFQEAKMGVALCMFFAGDAPNPLAQGEEAALVELKNAAGLANQFTAAGVNCYGVTGPWAIKIGAEGTLGAAEGFVLQVADKIAEPMEVDFHLEPLRKEEDLVIGSTAKALEILKAVDSGRLGLHFDTFHADRNDTQGIELALEGARKFVTYIHASDSHRHIPGFGNLDWQQVAAGLKRIGFTGPVVVECFGKEAAEELPGIVEGMSRPDSVERIVAVSASNLRKTGIIAPLE